MLKNFLKYFACILIGMAALPGCSQNKTIDDTNLSSIEETENLDRDNISKKVYEYIDNVEQKILENWPYMDKIWPGLDYTQNNAVIFYVDSEGEPLNAWVINTSGKRELTPEEYDNIDYPSVGGFSKIEFDGKLSTAVSIDASYISDTNNQNEAYNLLTHEMVHFYYQKDIVQEDDGGTRNQEYPILYEPRLYRNMIHENLANAILTDDEAVSTEYIQKAAYWYNKWKNEYTYEYNSIRETDIAEGQARYIECLANFIGKGITKEDILSKIDVKILTSIDSESYSLGYVALLLLDKFSPDFKQNFFEIQKSPIELLLENVPEMQDKEDLEIVDNLKLEIDILNKEIFENIAHIVNSMSDKTIPYLKINRDYITTSMSIDGFYSYEGNDIISSLSAYFKQDSSNGIKINEFSVLSDENYMIIPIIEEFEQKDDTLIFNGEIINGNIKVEYSVEDGRKTYTTK